MRSGAAPPTAPKFVRSCLTPMFIAINLCLLLGSRSKLVTVDCAVDCASPRGGGGDDWLRRGGEPRSSASSRRVRSSKLWWRLLGGGSASGSRVGAGGPFRSGAGGRH